MSEISELIEAKVNVHGELHLDAVQTQLLLRWMKNNERFNRESLAFLPELESVMKILKE